MKKNLKNHLLPITIIVLNTIGFLIIFYYCYNSSIHSHSEPIVDPSYTRECLIVFTLFSTIAIIIGIQLIIKEIKKPNKTITKINIITFVILILLTSCLCIKDIIFERISHEIKKPILYLYPEKTQKITINFEKENLLQTTYPQFKEEWKVLAKPDGTLIASDNKEYYALYWDEKNINKCKFEDGFYVEKENAINFLEDKLEIIGLNNKERNEFIMYWLPILENNGKSIVQFDLTDEIENTNKLIINPQPDSLLRVHINIKKVNKKTNIKEQKLSTFKRHGFTAVEWGGTIY